MAGEMSTLSIHSVDLATDLARAGEAPLVQTSDVAEIARVLAAEGIRFERWSADRPLPPDADQELVLSIYARDVARLSREHGYAKADVIRMTPDDPQREVARAKFLDEHTHAEDEVRFFVEGAGAFYLHLGARVFQVVCGAGDLLSVPAGTKHWFDMGAAPRFTVIRLFTSPEGWVAQHTGDPIAAHLPRFA
jgi:1,2-dihydroxy-3-keto-5-methylthiopentene dioxygenase